MDTKELLNFVLLVIGLQGGLGIILFALLRGTPGISFYSIGIGIIVLVTVSSGVGIVLYWLIQRYTKERAIKTAMMAMSEDEEKVLRIIMRRGKVRQDELRKEVGFSKSKLSALLKNLEKKNAVEKSRFKRTNHITPTEEFKN